MTGCNETQCSHCAHLKVCANKDIFLKMHESVRSASVSTPEPNGDTLITELRNLDWISVNLKCKHYMDMPIGGVRCEYGT